MDHPAAGILIGRFRLLHWLGSGGTGMWLAEDEVLLAASQSSCLIPISCAMSACAEFMREARAGGIWSIGIATVCVGDSTCGLHRHGVRQGRRCASWCARPRSRSSMR
jgi:hypothetical protein